MIDLPSRKDLANLTGSVDTVVPSVVVGLARRAGDRIALTYSYTFGMGGFALAEADVPGVLRPSSGVPRQTDATAFESNPDGAIERFLTDNGVQRVASFAIPRADSAARLWIGLTDSTALTGDQLNRLEQVADASASLLSAPVSPEDEADRRRRLELTAGLLPALLRVLDVREVFDRLSNTAQAVLPHDLLLLILFNEDLSRFTIFARSGQGSQFGPELPNQYPASTVRAWEFAIVDDHTLHPYERNTPATRMGARSSLRIPIRFDDRVIGGVGFVSFEPRRYSGADVAVGRRLADYVALALSHYQLAEQARQNEELRARTTNLELLDELLGTLTDTGDLADVFERISAIAGKVLPHDAAALIVHLPDRRHGRVYASTGYPAGLPDVIEIPDLLENPDWEHDVFDDLTQLKGPVYEGMASLGFRSLLRVPIRFDGRSAGALTFAAKSGAAFKQADVLIARRMADRLTVALARDREIDASRRADEAATRAARLEARVRALTEELDARTGYRRVVGESREWRQVLTQAAQVAATDTTVLLLGESGTGKEVVARFLHRGSSRKGGPFVALNCAALPEQLLEAELFGYERGAYTGATQSKPGQLEQAAGGTLFLDEVGEMSLPAQAKFLRVLQEREFQRLGGTRVLRSDARVVAATNRDLQRAIANGQFREDLYYRLNVFAIRLPPLRDRRDDILPLSEAFLAEIGRGLGRPPGGISRDARQLLIAYPWRGNVRELRNILERAAILCDGGLITPEHLALNVTAPLAVPAALAAAEMPHAASPVPPAMLPSAGDLQTMERAMIEQALQSARFNKSKAAKALGLTRHQLYIRMRKYGFD